MNGFFSFDGVKAALPDRDGVASDPPGPDRIFADEFVFAASNRSSNAPQFDRLPVAAFFTGDSGPNTLTGGDEGDFIRGFEGDDSLVGNGGDDTIDGGWGFDTLEGGAGDDSLIGFNGRDTMFGGDGSDILLGQNDTDTMFGENGDDSLDGARGVDRLYGGAGRDILRGGEEADTMSGGDGSDTFIAGPLSDFDGDQITDFAPGDRIVTDEKFSPTDLVITPTLLQIRIDTNNNGFDNVIFNLEGDFTNAIFHFEDNSTDLAFLKKLPGLADRRAVPTSLQEGMFIDDPRIRPGQTEIELKLSENISKSYYRNTLGVYEVDGEGNIVNVRFLIEDTTADPDASVKFPSLKSLSGFNDLGFFVVQDGKQFADTVSSSDTLTFMDTRDGSNATVMDGAYVRLAVNGVAQHIQVFHSYDSSLNRDGLEHVVSGVIEGGNYRDYYIGFEDMLGGGDMDFQDVVFYSDDWF